MKKLYIGVLAGIIFFSVGSVATATTITIDIAPTPTTVPENIGNLSIPFLSTNSATLHWKLPAVNTDFGSVYDIRYSTMPITATNFANAQTVTGNPIPFSKLQKQNEERMYTVSELTVGGTYYFAVKSKNEKSDWSKLSSVVMLKLPTQIPVTSLFTDDKIYFGQKNLNVSVLQSFLKNQNVYSGNATGYFGAQTKQAVIDFQTKNKINATGYVGEITLAKIKALLATQK